MTTRPVPPTVTSLHRLRDARPGLVRLARRHSLCTSDADDAVQRAFEILLRRPERVHPATALSWLRTVVKHEAMAIRSSRLRLLGGGDAELDAREAVELPGPWERATDRERAHRALAALATLKRDEARALVLQAAGRTYAEIEAETGWSHTKVNRALTEGRAAFRERVTAIDEGGECARHAPVLPALVAAAPPPTRCWACARTCARVGRAGRAWLSCVSDGRLCRVPTRRTRPTADRFRRGAHVPEDSATLSSSGLAGIGPCLTCSTSSTVMSLPSPRMRSRIIPRSEPARPAAGSSSGRTFGSAARAVGHA